MTKIIHHVGTVPAANTEAAMRLMMARTSDYQRTMPDGEVNEPGGDLLDQRADWVTSQLEFRGTHPDLVTLRRSRLREKPDMRMWHAPLYAPKPGRRVTPETLRLSYARHAARAVTILERLKSEKGRRDLRSQVGIPAPTNLAIMSWVNPLRHYPTEVQAAVEQIEAIHSLTDGAAVYQLEMPVELIAAMKVPAGRARAKLLDWFARLNTDFIAATPQGTAWIMHPCLADPHGKPMAVPPDAELVVNYVNALYRHWPSGRILDTVHLPLCEGSHPAAITLAYYDPLAGLELPASVRVSAGIVRAGDSPGRLRYAMETTQRAAKRDDFGVSTPCGLGRRPEAVPAVMDALVELAKD